MPNADFEQFLGELRAALSAGCRPSLAKQYARLYGTRARRAARRCASRSPISAGISGRSSTSARPRFLIETEWAETAEDVLERRTKHGLHMTSAKNAPPSPTGAAAGWQGRDDG